MTPQAFIKTIDLKILTPKLEGFVAGIVPTTVEKVFYVPQRKRKPNVEHYRKADDLWACIEVRKGQRFVMAGH